jgi:hypothetical protein
MGVAAFGNVTVEAESDEQAAKKLQAAVYALDNGELDLAELSYVEIDDGRRWEEGEISERGISP